MDQERKDASEAMRRKALAAAMALGRRCGFEEGHTLQVTRLALKLFDQLRGLHGLGGQERFWLHCAALLHDIGWVEGQKAHHKTALKLVLEDRTLPLDERQRRIVASIARYHRKALPSSRHDHFATLSTEDRRAVAMLGGLLRVADGLDRTHRDAVEDVRCETGPREIVIVCVACSDATAELEAARQKADLLEQAAGRAVVLREDRAARAR